MDMINSKSMVSLYLEDMYFIFFETNAILGYTIMHNQELYIHVTNQPCVTKQHWLKPHISFEILFLLN
jgi:hypothetical protein